jgi:L-aspartate oxidase
VHGANRLASNSLLEGMVFAARVTDALEAGRRRATPTGALRALLGEFGGIPITEVEVDVVESSTVASGLGVDDARRALQHAMTRGAGVVRSAASLHGVRASVAVAKAVARGGAGLDAAELKNLVTCAEALLASASARTESRGCHVREEYPTVDESWRRRLVPVFPR